MVASCARRLGLFSPLSVSTVQSTFLRDSITFPAGSVGPSIAPLMRDINRCTGAKRCESPPSSVSTVQPVKQTGPRLVVPTPASLSPVVNTTPRLSPPTARIPCCLTVVVNGVRWRTPSVALRGRMDNPYAPPMFSKRRREPTRSASGSSARESLPASGFFKSSACSRFVGRLGLQWRACAAIPPKYLHTSIVLSLLRFVAVVLLSVDPPLRCTTLFSRPYLWPPVGGGRVCSTQLATLASAMQGAFHAAYKSSHRAHHFTRPSWGWLLAPFVHREPRAYLRGVSKREVSPTHGHDWNGRCPTIAFQSSVPPPHRGKSRRPLCVRQRPGPEHRAASRNRRQSGRASRRPPW